MTESETHKFTFDYFLDEFRRYWDICGMRTTTDKQALVGFYGLTYVGANCEGDSRRITNLLLTAQINLEHRLPHFQHEEFRNG